MAVPVVLGADDQSVYLRFLDSTTFLEETGITAATGGLTLSYKKSFTGTSVSVTSPTITTLAAETTAHADWGIKHCADGTVRVDLPDAAIPTIENEVTLVSGSATGMIVLQAALVGVQPIGALGAGLTAVGLADGAITAAKIGADAITADALAADAAVEVAAAVWDRVLTGATHNINNSAGKRLRTLEAASIYTGTAQGGAANSITLDTGASATDQIYWLNLIVITAGTGAGQARVISNYAGATRVASVNRLWVTTPDATSEFQILASGEVDVTDHGLAQGGGASTITLAATASATDDIYRDQTVAISTSNGAGQARLITGYVGATKVATVSPAWQVQPTSTTVYSILPVGRVIVNSLATDSIDAAALKADAVAEIQAGLSTYAGGAVASVTGAVGSVTGNVGGNVVGSVASVTAGVTLAADAVSAAALSTAAAQEIADTVLRRTMANIEASSSGDTLSIESLYGLIAASFEAALASTVLTVRKSDGTTLGTKTLTLDAAATPIVGIT